MREEKKRKVEKQQLPNEGFGAQPENETEAIRQIVAYCNAPDTPGVTGMFRSEFISFDAQAKKLTLAFPCLTWEVSPRNNMMGGIVCAVFDSAMGMLTGLYAKEHYVTTLELTTRFIKPVRLGETLLVEAELLSQGKTILNMRATACAQSDGHLLAAAEAAFMLVKSLPADYPG